VRLRCPSICTNRSTAHGFSRVGATDTKKTTAITDDEVASFSSSGVVSTGGTKNPDLIAPGRSIISLAVPGSFLDRTYGAAGAVTGGYMRGSGTSQATAVVSGAARADPPEAPHLDQQPGQGPAHHHRQAAHLRDPDPGGAGKGPTGPGQGVRGDQRGRRLQLHQQLRSRQSGGRPGDRAPGQAPAGAEPPAAATGQGRVRGEPIPGGSDAIYGGRVARNGPEG
jgi:Subtilase family